MIVSEKELCKSNEADSSSSERLGKAIIALLVIAAVLIAALWLLKRMEPVYRYYPWKALLKSGTKGVALLICGEQDQAGSCVRYNKAWHKNSGIPLEWIKDAGHNSNTDQPEIVNRLIERLAEGMR